GGAGSMDDQASRAQAREAGRMERAKTATASRRRKMLGENPVGAGLITEEQLAHAKELPKQSPERPGRAVIRLGVGTEKDIALAIAKQLGLEFVDLDDVVPDEEALCALPEHLARRYQLIPLEVRDGTMKLGMVDPLDVLAIDDVRRQVSQTIHPV